METIKKILVPTDFSSHAEPAYQYAEEIACRFRAKVDFVHVVPTLTYFSESISRMEAPLDMIDEELYPTAQKEAKRQLKEAMDKYISEESKGELISNIDRKPSSAILRLAEEKDYDLIVMASKGRHGSHLLRGSTTSKVIRHSSVPVFAVDERLVSQELKRILLPTDGSMISFSALPLALMLADVLDAEITFYHVHELYGTSLDNESKNPDKSEKENIYDALLDHLGKFLAEKSFEANIELAEERADFGGQFILTEGASSKRIGFKIVIEKGVTAHLGIKDYATEHADIVVMATHGHGGLAHFFLGSTTEKVAHLLEMPVLTVRPSAVTKNKSA